MNPGPDLVQSPSTPHIFSGQIVHSLVLPPLIIYHPSPPPPLDSKAALSNPSSTIAITSHLTYFSVLCPLTATPILRVHCPLASGGSSYAATEAGPHLSFLNSPTFKLNYHIPEFQANNYVPNFQAICPPSASSHRPNAEWKLSEARPVTASPAAGRLTR